MRAHRGTRRTPGFTIVELLIVVMTLLILAGLVIPVFQDESFEARIVATQNTLRTMYTALDLYRVRFTPGQFPPQVMGSWFVGNRVPPNPMAVDGRPFGTVSVVSLAGQTDPMNKTLESAPDPFWYNRATGILRARVPAQATPEKTDELYGRVNSVGRKPPAWSGKVGALEAMGL